MIVMLMMWWFGLVVVFGMWFLCNDIVIDIVSVSIKVSMVKWWVIELLGLVMNSCL